MKIVTKYNPPPVPFRCADWYAYQEGTEEEGPYGWGATELEAIEDLQFILEENADV